MTSCATLRTYLSREMALMRDYALNELISPPSLVCKKNSSHLHSLRVGFLFNCTDLGKLDAKLVQNCHAGELGRGALRQDKQRAHFIYNCNFLCFAGLSLRGGGRGFSSVALTWFRLLSWENRTKIGPKEILSCYIPCLLVAFTQQLEIFVKSLVCLLPMRVLGCLPFTRTYH